MAETNRRQSPRQTTEATVQVFLTANILKDSTDSGDLISVSLYNQSESGFYFEIDRALQPGSNISIKMIAPEEQRSEDPYFIRDGQVVWCKKVDDENLRFGVGMKILRKVVQADVLTSRFR